MTKDTLSSILIGRKIILRGNWPTFMSNTVHNFGYYIHSSVNCYKRSASSIEAT